MEKRRLVSRFSVLLLITVLFSGGIAACATADVATRQVISAEDAIQLIDDGAFLLDVRTPAEYQEAHLEGSTLIPLDTLAARADELPRDEPIVIYCRSGNRSLQAVYLLEQAGFERVHSMDLGINNWIAQGYDVVR